MTTNSCLGGPEHLWWQSRSAARKYHVRLLWLDRSSSSRVAAALVCCLCPACYCLQINVVMDYANGGSLFEYVQARTKLPEALARCEKRNSEWGGGRVQHK